MSNSSNATPAANFTARQFRQPDFANKFNFTGRPGDFGIGDGLGRKGFKDGNSTVYVDNSRFERKTPLAFSETRKS